MKQGKGSSGFACLLQEPEDVPVAAALLSNVEAALVGPARDKRQSGAPGDGDTNQYQADIPLEVAVSKDKADCNFDQGSLCSWANLNVSAFEWL